MLVTPPFGASSNIALWRAYSKPPVELVVADLEIADLKAVGMVWYDKVRFLVPLFDGWYFLRKMGCEYVF